MLYNTLFNWIIFMDNRGKISTSTIAEKLKLAQKDISISNNIYILNKNINIFYFIF